MILITVYNYMRLKKLMSTTSCDIIREEKCVKR